MAQRIKTTNEKTENSSNQLTEKQKKWIKAGLFFGAIIVLFIVNNIDGEPDNGPYPPGYQQYSNQTVSLSDYSGNVVVLNFLSVDNTDCQKTIPDLVSIKNEYSDKGIEVIGIVVDQENKEADIKNLLNRLSVNYPVVWANESVKYKYGGIKTIPATFIIDQDGKVVSHHIGYVNRENIVDELDKVFTGEHKQSEMIDAPEFSLPLLSKVGS